MRTRSVISKRETFNFAERSEGMAIGGVAMMGMGTPRRRVADASTLRIVFSGIKGNVISGLREDEDKVGSIGIRVAFSDSVGANVDRMGVLIESVGFGGPTCRAEI